MPSGTRWGRAIGAGILAELLLFALTFLMLLIYAKTGDRTTPEKMVFAHVGSLWLTGIAGPLLLFRATRWALRGVTTARLGHAIVVTALAGALQFAMDWPMVDEGHVPVWGLLLSHIVMLAGGIAAGLRPPSNPATTSSAPA